MKADSILDSTKSWEEEGSREGKGKRKLLKKMKKDVLTIERYRHKRLPSFDDKSSCSTEFNSWKMVLVDWKNSIVVWDVDETYEKQRKHADDLFKLQFQQWKFDIQRVAEHGQVDDAAANALADDPEEE
ncbi:cytochrome P450 CYP736A12-like [Pyrus ussuriensis x Pyrus communis]|uniref:Cytochrome P450 CYP736A12-like n=1 Tax=Pyrus ussuriensis x Pyrus communis TaxID=2448454 RepID=A0A5N5GGP9_9ROSA|nr:cytochrome P450 CYP736A12-like [Pyrus ussuriensis x Pyrus communis]